MEQDGQRRFQPRKKRLRLRWGRVLLLLVLVISGYTYWQFQAGQKLAEQARVEAEPFVGDEVSGDIENYLLLGVDSRGEEQSRTDTMIVLSWNKETNALKLLSFMRDIYADIPGFKSYKLNTAYYLGGAQLTKDTISSMFNMPIHHYAVIDFRNFESLIDVAAPNGVEIDVEKNMSEQIDVELTKGVHALNGKELLGYARFRQDAEGDFGRVRRQQQVMDALTDELLSLSNVRHYPKMLGALQGYVTTDVSMSAQLQTVLKLAAGGGVTLDKLTIPVEGTYDFRSYAHAGSVIVIDQQANNERIRQFLAQ